VETIAGRLGLHPLELLGEAAPEKAPDGSVIETACDNIDRFRRELGLLQSELDEASGIAVSTVHKWKTGEVRPWLVSLEAIADVFGVPLTALLTEHDLPGRGGGT